MNIEIHGKYESLVAQRSQALAVCIDELYEVFRRYKYKPITGAMSDYPEENEVLRTVPLRKLTGEQLSFFAGKALYTWGDEDDLRHFLPRLLELIGRENHGGALMPEMVSAKFCYKLGNWKKWPVRERKTVIAFFEAYFYRVLAEFPCELSPVEDALCTAAGAMEDLSPLLLSWLRDDSAPAACHMADLVIECAYRKGEAGPRNAFWNGERREQQQQALAFLQSNGVAKYFERMYFKFEKVHPEIAAALSMAEGQLEWMRRVPHPK
jgi:hypothetical protein